MRVCVYASHLQVRAEGSRTFAVTHREGKGASEDLVARLYYNNEGTADNSPQRTAELSETKRKVRFRGLPPRLCWTRFFESFVGWVMELWKAPSVVHGVSRDQRRLERERWVEQRPKGSTTALEDKTPDKTYSASADRAPL